METTFLGYLQTCVVFVVVNEFLTTLTGNIALARLVVVVVVLYILDANGLLNQLLLSDTHACVIHNNSIN